MLQINAAITGSLQTWKIHIISQFVSVQSDTNLKTTVKRNRNYKNVNKNQKQLPLQHNTLFSSRKWVKIKTHTFQL